MRVMVRPPGFEPGTRGWKPLVITPSLQGGNSKVDALTMGHDSKAEVWDFTCNTISANKWPFMEDGSRVCRSGVPIWRV